MADKETGLVIKVQVPYDDPRIPDYLTRYFRGTKWNNDNDQFDYILTEHLQKAKIFLDNPIGRKNAEATESILKIYLGKKANVSIVECAITTLDKHRKNNRQDLENAMELLRANGFNVEPPM